MDGRPARVRVHRLRRPVGGAEADGSLGASAADRDDGMDRLSGGVRPRIRSEDRPGLAPLEMSLLSDEGRREIEEAVAAALAKHREIQRSGIEYAADMLVRFTGGLVLGLILLGVAVWLLEWL